MLDGDLYLDGHVPVPRKAMSNLGKPCGSHFFSSPNGFKVEEDPDDAVSVENFRRFPVAKHDRMIDDF